MTSKHPYLRRWSSCCSKAKKGEGSTIIYDLPSSLMRAKGNSNLLQAAQVLDAKMAALVSAATGAAA